LGASAVARAAGVVAANEFAGNPLAAGDVLTLVSELEGHGDNAAPALLGGMQVCVHAGDHYVAVPCRYPESAAMAILIPDHSMPTKEARKALPDGYSRADTVHNIGRAALFVAAMAQGRMDALREATDDRVHQPYRASIFPPLFTIIDAARAAGAHATWLSGAGSSVASICDAGCGREVAAAMLDALRAAGMAGRSLVTKIAREGTSVSRIELVEI
jgi:homoserine kinase